ncbi:DoxX family protein [uncultured Acinetobacter sp.]|uniref:DoxX family protein n=1 Tax=uncultured Acinetobacter sp. TaxID=165433 RepID=UPI0037481E5A
MFNPDFLIERLIGCTNSTCFIDKLSRILMSSLFIYSGWYKILNYSSTVEYMEAMGVSSIFLPLTFSVEFISGLALFLGFQTRIFTLILLFFCLVTAYIFHCDKNPIDINEFMKNLAIAGGLMHFLICEPSKLIFNKVIRK